jgi:hypothetical protein
MNFYNDNDPRICAWLEELKSSNLIPKGAVDGRDIRDIRVKDLAGFTQHHFFCGVGGWPAALELAGWPRERPVWSASLPCQPWSNAGEQKGSDDSRNLWPTFYRLLCEFGPECVCGEQVEAAIGLGWLDGISDDLEAAGYTVGAIALPACSVGARHTDDTEFSGWLTAKESNTNGPGIHGDAGKDLQTVAMSAWVSPTAQDQSRGSKPPKETDTGIPLSQQVASWGTPASRDHKDGHCDMTKVEENGLLPRQVLGAITNSATSPTVKSGGLNPALSRWLQGYPKEWCQAAILAYRKFKTPAKREAGDSTATETALSRNSRRSSSSRSSKLKQTDKNFHS